MDAPFVRVGIPPTMKTRRSRSRSVCTSNHACRRFLTFGRSCSLASGLEPMAPQCLLVLGLDPRQHVPERRVLMRFKMRKDRIRQRLDPIGTLVSASRLRRDVTGARNAWTQRIALEADAPNRPTA